MDTFRRGSLVFDVRDTGPHGGDVAILLHGFPQDSTAWRPVEPALHEAGLRTLAPDQRGYSPNASPTGVSAYRMQELVADVVALMDAADAPRAHLVGHDWGGGVAWAAAAQHPERFSTLTVLSTPHPGALARSSRDPEQLRKGWYRTAFQVPRLPELALAGRVGGLLRRAAVPAADHYGSRFPDARSLTGPINWYRANRSLGADVTGEPTMPTTYVWGSRDVALGRRAAELTHRFVAGPYRFVELDADHWLPEKESARVAVEIVRQTR